MMKGSRLRDYMVLNRRAFTIVEILVVVLLLALLAGAAFSGYFGTYKRMLVEKAANDIYLTAKYARLLAVEKQESCLLVLNDEKNSFALTFSKTDEEGKMQAGSVIADRYSRPTTFADGVEYEKAVIVPSGSVDEDAEEQKFVTFYSDGTADSAVIQIGDGKNVYTVLIRAATGKAKVFRGMPEETAMGAVDLDAANESY